MVGLIKSFNKSGLYNFAHGVYIVGEPEGRVYQEDVSAEPFVEVQESGEGDERLQYLSEGNEGGQLHDL